MVGHGDRKGSELCHGAVRTECICKSRQTLFVSCAVSWSIAFQEPQKAPALTIFPYSSAAKVICITMIGSPGRAIDRFCCANSTAIFCVYDLRTNEGFFESPCWRVFLALRINAVSRNDGIAQTVDNLAEAGLGRSFLFGGRNAAIKTRSIDLAVFFRHLAYYSTAATAA